MKKTTLFFSVLTLFFFACEKDSEPVVLSKTDLLTSGSQKTWYTFSSTPEPLCSSTHDDTYTFFADGSFEYDHGIITESDDGECGDLINLEGTWKFEENESAITITALRAKGATEDMDPLTIIQADITELTIGRLVLVSKDGTSGTLEFRPKQ
jgi:VCBS repeat-containing protein